MQSHEARIGGLEGQANHAVTMAERAEQRAARAEGRAAEADAQARKAAERATNVEGDIRRLDAAREYLVGETRDIRFGMAADGKVLVIALAVLGTVSLVEAVAIVALWWTR